MKLAKVFCSTAALSCQRTFTRTGGYSRFYHGVVQQCGLHANRRTNNGQHDNKKITEKPFNDIRRQLSHSNIVNTTICIQLPENTLLFLFPDHLSQKRIMMEWLSHCKQHSSMTYCHF